MRCRVVLAVLSLITSTVAAVVLLSLARRRCFRAMSVGLAGFGTAAAYTAALGKKAMRQAERNRQGHLQG